MRYDPAKNRLSVNQDQTAKAIVDLIAALQEAKASDGKLTNPEIFMVAAKHAPAAAKQIITISTDNVPNGIDAYKVAFGVTNQFELFK